MSSPATREARKRKTVAARRAAAEQDKARRLGEARVAHAASAKEPETHWRETLLIITSDVQHGPAMAVAIAMAIRSGAPSMRKRIENITTSDEVGALRDLLRYAATMTYSLADSEVLPGEADALRDLRQWLADCGNVGDPAGAAETLRRIEELKAALRDPQPNPPPTLPADFWKMLAA